MFPKVGLISPTYNFRIPQLHYSLSDGGGVTKVPKSIGHLMLAQHITALSLYTYMHQ